MPIIIKNTQDIEFMRISCKLAAEVLDYIEAVRKMRGMTVMEKTDTKRAINLYRKYKIKLGDCFIVMQVPKGAILVTYDEDFKKIKEVSSQTPDAIEKNYSKRETL